MKTFGLALILIGATLALVPATAQEACKTSFEITGKADNMWHVGAATNPALTACPEQSITINAVGEAGVHNIIVTGVTGAPAAMDVNEGETAAYVFTAPASGSAQYVCQYHSSTMKGTMSFAASSGSATPTPAANDDKDSPGLGALGVILALVGAVLVIGRRR